MVVVEELVFLPLLHPPYLMATLTEKVRVNRQWIWDALVLLPPILPDGAGLQHILPPCPPDGDGVLRASPMLMPQLRQGTSSLL